MQQTRTHKAVTRRVEAKKLLSRRRQSQYSQELSVCSIIFDWITLAHLNVRAEATKLVAHDLDL